MNGRWEPGGAGQLVRSSNFGMTWSLTNSHDAVGIGNDVTFVDISQNPEDPVSIPQLVAHSSLRGSTFRRFCAVSATVSESVDLWGQDDIVVTGSSPYSPWVVPANSSNHSFKLGGYAVHVMVVGLGFCPRIPLRLRASWGVITLQRIT